MHIEWVNRKSTVTMAINKAFFTYLIRDLWKQINGLFRIVVECHDHGGRRHIVVWLAVVEGIARGVLKGMFQLRNGGSKPIKEI